MKRNCFLLLSPTTVTNNTFLQALFATSYTRKVCLGNCYVTALLGVGGYMALFTPNCVLPSFYGLFAQPSILLVLFREWKHLLMCRAFCVHKLLHMGT